MASGPVEDALKYEGEMLAHCVGGYCDDVADYGSRIFSLRDRSNIPHVTIATNAGGKQMDSNSFAESDFKPIKPIKPIEPSGEDNQVS